MTFSSKNMARPVPLKYTAKNINATPASRTAIAADLVPGYCVIQDVYADDYKTVAGVSGGVENRTEVAVTRPQSSHLHRRAYVVTNVPPSCNKIPDSSASTQRAGGSIEGVWDSPQILAYVADGTAIGDSLVLTNGSFVLSASTTVTAITDIKSFKATALEANSSGAAALRYVSFNGGC